MLFFVYPFGYWYVFTLSVRGPCGKEGGRSEVFVYSFRGVSRGRVGRQNAQNGTAVPKGLTTGWGHHLADGVPLIQTTFGSVSNNRLQIEHKVGRRGWGRQAYPRPLVHHRAYGTVEPELCGSSYNVPGL